MRGFHPLRGQVQVPGGSLFLFKEGFVSAPPKRGYTPYGDTSTPEGVLREVPGGSLYILNHQKQPLFLEAVVVNIRIFPDLG
jgi:hypothetical protein